MKYILKLMILIIISFVSGNTILKNKNGKDIIRNEGVVSFISTIIIFLSWMFLRKKWTVYEFFITTAIVSTFLSLVLKYIRNKKLSKTDLLLGSCLISVACAVYSILTVGQVVLHSDTATATLLVQSQLKNHSFFPRSWNYVNGEIWVISMNLTTVVTSVLMKNQSLARMVSSAIYLIIILGFIRMHSKKVFWDNSWLLSIPLFVVFLFSSFDMILYQAAYTGQMLWIVVCTMLIFCIFNLYEEKEKNKYTVIFCIIMILLLMTGMRMAAEQTIPLWCACAVLIYKEIIQKKESGHVKKQIKKLAYLTTVIFVSSIIGYVIYLWLCSWHNVNITAKTSTVFVSTFTDLVNNLVLTIQNFFVAFGYMGNVSMVSIYGIRNFISITICTLICFVIPYLQWKKLETENDAVKLFFWYGVFHNLIMIIISAFFDKMVARYLLTSIFVCIILSARYIYKYWLCDDNCYKNTWIFLFIFATAFECAGILKDSQNWNPVLQSKKKLNQVLIDKNISKGYATYWNAYNNQLYSDMQITYGGINLFDNQIQSYKWLVDSEVFEPVQGDSFLLLTKEEDQQYKETVEKILGEYKERLKINDRIIYIYDYDIVQKFDKKLEE